MSSPKKPKDLLRASVAEYLTFAPLQERAISKASMPTRMCGFPKK